MLEKQWDKHQDVLKIKEAVSFVQSGYALTGMARSRPNDPFSQPSPIISSVEVAPSDSAFATGSVKRQIQIFSLPVLDNYEQPDTLEPRLTISTVSKISCLSWNPFHADQIFSSDYEGAVKMYNASIGKEVVSWLEHEKRIWSIDISKLDPSRIASTSDDCKVKIWTMNKKTSVMTIDVRANGCAIAFSPTNVNQFAVGAADHRIHLFDMRKPHLPIASLKQHRRTVSYVRYAADGNSIFSSSTDGTIIEWVSNSEASWIPQGTFSSHVNEKNFTGLSVKDNLIACGSEDNTVHLYHKHVPDTSIKYPLANICPLTAASLENEQGTFISSVSWTNSGKFLLAANSAGIVEIMALTSQ